MIPARKSRLFGAFFSRHARNRIAATFGAVRAHGLDEVRAASAAPLIIVSNHTSWWDPLFAIFLSVRELGLDAYAMMDATNLRRLPFFGRVGAFGVDLDDPADGARAIRYAAKLLDRPRRAVWIFAQGRERPITERPIVFRGGSAEIARVARARVVPAALRYEFGPEERPTAFVSFGPSLDADRDVARAKAAQESAVGRELDRIDEALRDGDRAAAFPAVLSRRPSAIALLAERMLAALTR